MGLLLAGAVAIVFWPVMPGPMEQASQRIRVGMTVKEVHDIFGELPKESEVDPQRFCMIAVWEGEDGYVAVDFSFDFLVKGGKSVVLREPEFFLRGEPSIFESVRNHLRSWIGLKPRRWLLLDEE